MKLNIKKLRAAAFCLSIMMLVLAACGNDSLKKSANINDSDVPLASQGTAAPTSEAMSFTEGEAAGFVNGGAAISGTLMPVASGKVTKGNDKVVIDASNTQDGYIMIKYLKQTSKKLKMIVTGPSGVKYTYNINKIGEFETFPLSDGSGKYSINIYENISGTSYSTVYGTSLSVSLTNEFAPYLLPNQYVNYTANGQVAGLAKTLTANKSGDLQKINAVYDWVIKNISYDKQLAATVKSGYLPNLDTIIVSKKGICFDYASLMTAMLRSRGIPCKLVIGYAGSSYHAWINAYTSENGWIDGVIYFDGSTWKLMDPTFASTGNQSESIMKYIGDGKNYSAKYLY
ncbi:MAG: transglutaminase domain-containing protein [Anaerovoracaceae bacterium]